MKIGIVNDVNMAVQVLERLIDEKTDHQVIWKAFDGKEAVEKCRNNTPDIVLMDLIMPVMDGVEATKRIMESCPCAILIVTSSVKRNMEKVFDSMGYGALDVVKTPSLGVDGEEDTIEELIKKIEMLGKLVGHQHEKKKIDYRFDNKGSATRLLTCHTLPPIVAIGASTGGPKAVATILSRFPADVPFATIIIQHIDHEFSKSLARWLDEQTTLNVRVAEVGEKIKKGTVYLSGNNQHLVIDENGRLNYSMEPKELPYQPSVDVFFNSLKNFNSAKFIAILLTGMGSDGAHGLKSLRQEGWYTIAQEQSSCVVFGMPKVAIDVNAAIDVLSLEKMSDIIIERSKSIQIGACADE
jgi:two-component system, chemotaxis family, response regulator WspF